MKRNIKYNLYGILASAMMLGATSCKDDTFAGLGEEFGDTVKVSFNINPDGNVATRAAGAATHISDGTKADMLVYAIYDKDGALLEEYALGKGTGVPASKKIGAGQTIIMTDFPHTITMTLKRGEEYKIAFWAQSSKTDAYDTSDLHKVDVNYSQITEDGPSAIDGEDLSSSTPNNDEWRDAFCRTITVTPGNSGNIEQNVNLFRPWAQINVGTNGYDYEIATRATNTKYLYSKIRINRVARYLDVVADQTYTSTTENEESSTLKTPEAFAVVDFGWAPIPAYNNKAKENGEYDLPEFPSYTKWDWINNPDFELQTSTGKIDKDNYERTYGDEEFLRVHHEKDGADWVEKSEDDEFVPYANLNDNYDKDSETFKWLSMCYVLTSSTETDPVVINNVKVWLSTDGTDDNAVEIVNINHVPAQKNWRTNIIGNLLTEENDFTVKLDKAFAGDYSGWNAGENWKWTGPLASGVYYNGVEDVIEISSLEGFLWFQKMVNGTITVREAPKKYKEAMAGKPYKYYDSDGKSYDFVYNGISEVSDPELRQRILIATHQLSDDPTKTGWPKDNNFHFTGKKKNDKGELEDYPANVRLMTDINLSNIEWIPIGFDGRIGEQLGWSVIPNDADGYNATDDNATGRIFYGTFDGNGHTIYNLTTKRFSANVHESAQQENGYRTVYKNRASSTRHPSDNPQWFARGLFGQIGGNARITNVRLNNVDIYGCNGVGGVVGVAYGDAIEISNCVVDGGSIIATPMYRGDSYNKKRTFARGVYMGGIVGYFNTDGGKVDNNIVRNVYMQAVRRGGGLIGSINQQWMDPNHDKYDEGQGLVDGTWTKKQRESHPASISNNQLANITMIISSFATFGEKMETNADGIVRAGFGYNNGNLEMYSNKFIGGYTQDGDVRSDLNGVFTGNSASGVTVSLLTIEYDLSVRKGVVGSLPLNYMPMLSSWYADYVDLHDNYYGLPSAHNNVKLHDFKFWSELPTRTGYGTDNDNFNSSLGFVSGTEGGGGTNFYFPINLPFEVDIDYLENSPKAGVFVESITLDGKGGVGGRSVITPTNVTGNDDCVMYITARNRYQFGSNNYVASAWPEYMKGYEGQTIKSFKAPTIVKNVVLRGEPYASNGILLAPNKNMHRVELENVAIYDVYKTLALYDWGPGSDTYTNSQKQWPNWNMSFDALRRSDSYGESALMPHLIVRNSNLRGYTVPGALWDHIDYSDTTFERGASTGHDSDEYTCKVETKTNFKDCYFKAPYIIDWSDSAKGGPTFDNSYATAASVGSNVKIDLNGKSGCNKIVITTTDGMPIVKYYKDGTELK